ncbi:ATP-binding cassette domain-containing protein [Shewanella insulae]|uniref:ATP-binding cassette domain-containing protein n=1 Tax=Shewanella insulae TaxID=2681496 RepID=UPI001EFE6AED|nr:ATP-binding cassette domain-containing protein [Shewanella insulae]MCG9737092.1 ATP-binding cassette domain-containing protein [Shewanella insulae]
MALVRLSQIHFNFQTAAQPLFEDLNLTIAPGECHLIHGYTGCGKSTLLKLLLGILERPWEGEREIAEGATLGVVMQDPNVQLLRQTLGAEVAFALENLGVASNEMLLQVRSALRRVGLYISLDTPIASLSLGQRYRLMIAAQLVLEPDLLLLDEPWAQLDDQGVAELSAVLNQLKQQGVALLIVEHHRGVFKDLVTHRWQLSQGKLHGVAPAQAEASPSQECWRESPAWPQGEAVIDSHGFTLAFHDRQKLFDAESLLLFPGEIAALVGDNGCGKSTLLKSLAGIQADIDPIGIKVFGKKPKLGRFGADLALLHQRPSRQLFENTVIEEIQFSLRRFGLPLEWAIELLGQLGLTTLARHSPHTLSYGQQHLIALASLACFRPKLLLLDDPFAGLDEHFTSKIVALLLELSRQGTAVVVASHRPIAELPIDRLWRVADARLECFGMATACEKQALSRVG